MKTSDSNAMELVSIEGDIGFRDDRMSSRNIPRKLVAFYWPVEHDPVTKSSNPTLKQVRTMLDIVRV